MQSIVHIITTVMDHTLLHQTFTLKAWFSSTITPYQNKICLKRQERRDTDNRRKIQGEGEEEQEAVPTGW